MFVLLFVFWDHIIDYGNIRWKNGMMELRRKLIRRGIQGRMRIVTA